MKIISEKKFNSLIKKFSKISPILVAGDLGIDKYTMGEVSRISPEAPVPVLEVKSEWMKLGLAANVSHNLQALGIDTGLCGVLGHDNNGDLFCDLMRASGLSTDNIVRVSGRPTTFKERITTKTQQICRVDYECSEVIKSSEEKILLDLMNKSLKSYGALIIEDYGKGLFSKKLTQEVIRIARKAKMLITVDPSRKTPPIFYKGADLLKPNFQEAKIMVSSLGYTDNDVGIMSEILCEKLDLKYVVITLGGEGMAILDRDDGEMQIVPTVQTEVFDVSGAGDTAISVITAGLLAGGSLEEAAWIANCASGVVVGKSGTATVDVNELTSFYFNKLLKINSEKPLKI